MLILRMILLGLTAADGFYSQTLNAVHHYRTGYYNRKGFSECHYSPIFLSYKNAYIDFNSRFHDPKYSF